MDVKDVKDQFQNYFDDKLKNPYIASVVATWIFTNRVILFGVFNFEDGLTADAKITWVQYKLSKFDKLDFLWGFTGFWATIFYAFLVGALVMLAWTQITPLGKALYKWASRTGPTILQKIEPSSWIKRKEYEKELKDKIIAESELITKGAEIGKLKSENQTALDQYAKVLEEKRGLSGSLVLEQKAREEAQTERAAKQTELDAFTKGFKIIYAQYGIENRYIEVTKMVGDLLEKNKTLQATNETFLFDPFRYKVKELHVEYQYDGVKKEITVIEGDILKLDNNLISAEPTESSKRNQTISVNKIKIADLFHTGDWVLTYTHKDTAKNGFETVLIDPDGKYLADGKHLFNVIVPELTDTNIMLEKIHADSNLRHAKETLKILNKDMIQGTDDQGFTLLYQRKKAAPRFN
jgi:hypothetical protein